MQTFALTLRKTFATNRNTGSRRIFTSLRGHYENRSIELYKPFRLFTFDFQFIRGSYRELFGVEKWRSDSAPT
jgi:hypothetical protein